GFLSTDISAGAAMEIDVKVVTAAENVFAEEILFASLLKRATENFRPFDEFTADVEVGQVNVVRIAGNDHPFEQLMRVLVNDLAVFECPRLGLVRVAYEVNRFAAFAVHERPFQPARKPRAAAAAQARIENFLANLLRAAH